MSSKSGFALSRRLPGFLLADMTRGQAHGWLNALDEFLRTIGNAACSDAMGLSARWMTDSDITLELERLGFHVNSLDSRRKKVLFDCRAKWLATRDRVATVQELANLYCPGAVVRYGFPYKAARLGTRGVARLGGGAGSQPVIFIRVPDSFLGGEALELQRVLSALFTGECRFLVVPTEGEPTRVGRIRLDGAMNWKQRRL